MLKKTKEADAMISKLEDLIDQLSIQRDDLQEKFDNRSEKWQESDKGEEMQTDISTLDDVISSLESAKDDLQNAFEI